MKFLANADLTLSITYSNGGSSGVATITSPLPSTKVKANGKGIYFGAMTVSVAGVINGAASVPGAPVVVSIQPTATKNKSQGQFPLRVDDSATGVASPTNPNTGVVVTTNFTVKISNAGQSKVKGN